jgi:protein-disulfide isomerase
MKAFEIAAMTAVLIAYTGAAGLNGQEKASEKKLDKAEIEAIIREYILEHPEVLLESVRLHEERQRMAAIDRSRKALATHEQELLRDKDTPWAGAQSPEVTVVQFFDYRCGYCKRALGMVSKAAGQPGVRVVYKELPILGPESVEAARVALAAHAQGKYREVHESLMSGSGSMNKDVIEQLASKHGLDLERLKKDMDSPAVSQTLAKNQALAMALGVNSTPTFVIGSEVIPGALPPEQFSAKIESFRKKSPQP